MRRHSWRRCARVTPGGRYHLVTYLSGCSLFLRPERCRCRDDTQDAACTLDLKVAHDRCLNIYETGRNAVILYNTMPSGSRVKVRKIKNDWETQILFDAQRASNQEAPRKSKTEGSIETTQHVNLRKLGQARNGKGRQSPWGQELTKVKRYSTDKAWDEFTHKEHKEQHQDISDEVNIFCKTLWEI